MKSLSLSPPSPESSLSKPRRGGGGAAEAEVEEVGEVDDLEGRFGLGFWSWGYLLAWSACALRDECTASWGEMMS